MRSLLKKENNKKYKNMIKVSNPISHITDRSFGDFASGGNRFSWSTLQQQTRNVNQWESTYQKQRRGRRSSQLLITKHFHIFGKYTVIAMTENNIFVRVCFFIWNLNRYKFLCNLTWTYTAKNPFLKTFKFDHIYVLPLVFC